MTIGNQNSKLSVDLEQAGNVDQLRLAPQAGVGRSGCRFTFLDERIFAGVPDQVA